MGCHGGMYDTLWNYSKENNGICMEEDYPYVSGTTTKTGKCEKNCIPLNDAKVKSYVNVKTGSDESLMAALNIQPVSIAIEADTKSFQLYKSGIYSDYEGCGTNLDHAVVLVGYQTSDNENYYILRNSWGESWGEDGYRGLQKIQNMSQMECGLLQDPMYPLL